MRLSNVLLSVTLASTFVLLPFDQVQAQDTSEIEPKLITGNRIPRADI